VRKHDLWITDRQAFSWAKDIGTLRIEIPFLSKRYPVDILIMTGPDDLVYSYCLQVNRFQCARGIGESIENIIELITHHLELRKKQGEPLFDPFPHPSYKVMRGRVEKMRSKEAIWESWFRLATKYVICFGVGLISGMLLMIIQGIK